MNLFKLSGKSVFFVVAVTLPLIANAGFFSFVTNLFTGDKQEEEDITVKNSQNIALIRAIISPDPSPKGGGDIVVVGGTALLPETGPSGTVADIGENHSSEISLYVVRPGDTISAISKMFGVTTHTIIGANNIERGIIQPGQTLIIFPISGLQYTVKSGDTIATIAKKYKADSEEISQYNNLDSEDSFKVGDTIFIPDAELPYQVATPSGSRYYGSGGPVYEGYYMKPLLSSRKTQGLHGYNGVDLAAPAGTPVFASAEGSVIISRSSGWNGGYGNYVVISHPNGTQTLYSHLSGVTVYEGMSVVRGELVGYVGSTGKSTGPHLHFEVRGAKNPF